MTIREKIEIPEEEKILRKDKYGLIEEFASKLENLDVNNNTFYKKLKTLKVCKDPSMEKNRAAKYSLLTNEIHLGKKFKKTIMHELLHASSTIVDGNYVSSGLSQVYVDEDKIIGVGLNEGITAIIDEKYFSDYDYPNMISKYISELLFYAFGEKFIMECYFNSDLKSLYKRMSAYIGNKKAFEIIKSLDEIYYMIDYFHIKDVKAATYHIRRSMINIAEITIYDAYLAYYLNQISEEILDFKLDHVEALLKDEIEVCGKNRIPIITDQNYNNYLLNIENRAMKKVLTLEKNVK